MKFTPLTEQQIAEQNLIPEGYYRYKVTKATDKISQAGSEMIELNVEVFVGNSTRPLFDYLLSSFLMKLNHFCKVNGMMDKYDNGTLTSNDCWGKSQGFVNVGTQKDKTGKYSDKSVIKDYVLEIPAPKITAAALHGKPAGNGGFDPNLNDDVPF